jgi:hypothetical protein
MISDKFQCIFIHIPKNAGTSIESKISSEERTINLLPDHRTILDMEPLSVSMLYKKDSLYSIARRVKYYFQKRRLGSFYKETSRLRYKNYYKFTIVRNPWSRVYSWYRNVMADSSHRNRYNVPDNCSFQDFVKYHFDHHHALRTQFYWLTDSKGNITMDFIGRFENLQDDFMKIAGAIGLQNCELPRKRYTGESALYVEAFNAQTRDRLWRHYTKEIQYFGFEFGE